MDGPLGNAATRQLQTLFEHGVAAGISDGVLVERFTEGDRNLSEHAFTAIVERHGAMVFGVCRKLLRQQQDAEDAFQASFLVLAKSARSIRKPDLLSNWLFGVARKTALKARSRRKRIQGSELRSVDSADFDPSDPSASVDERLETAEASRLLLEELSKLHEPYRSAIVLCDLEGLSHAEAASRLSCAEGTISARISRGRAMLRKRLARTGESAVQEREMLGALGATMAVPRSLYNATVRAAIQVKSGFSASGLVSTSVSLLVKEVLATMSWSKTFITVGFALMACSTLVYSTTKANRGGFTQERQSSTAQALEDGSPTQQPGLQPSKNAQDVVKQDVATSAPLHASFETELLSRLADYKRASHLVVRNVMGREGAAQVMAKLDETRAKVVDAVESLKEELESIGDERLVMRAELNLKAASEKKFMRLFDNMSNQNEANKGSDQNIITRMAQLKGEMDLASAEVEVVKAKLQVLTRREERLSAKISRYEELTRRFGKPGDPVAD